MIEVTYDGETELTVAGHAGAGDPGKDLVCAAVTALTLALGESAARSSAEPGFAKLSGGNKEIYEAFARGYGLLAKFFPDNVHLRCLNNEKEQNDGRK